MRNTVLMITHEMDEALWFVKSKSFVVRHRQPQTIAQLIQINRPFIVNIQRRIPLSTRQS
jgi:ABC-type nitrate/sulfonate/bicarbonate transport system ATPase subunit